MKGLARAHMKNGTELGMILVRLHGTELIDAFDAEARRLGLSPGALAKMFVITGLSEMRNK